ncbi:MAG: low molecular weight phosphotyrosine protein phosphatase [Gammaproteobacteria bacterium]|nr:low molecular weight phosphotyrosine protein phosphatase [Gammaproteobacteria bacterium]
MSQSVLFVCSLNVCRSVAAHGVFRYILRETGLDAVADSAGVSAGGGAPPETLVRRAAELRGYDLSGIRSKPLAAASPGDCDYLVAMDSSQLPALRGCCANGAVVRLLMDYSDYFNETEVAVPPPHEGVEGCLRMFDRIEDACLGLWRALNERGDKYSGEHEDGRGGGRGNEPGGAHR